MADHQPDVRPEHGDMVGDRLGVRRPDADVHHRDPRVVRPDQVEGRHLRQPRRRRPGPPVAGDHRVARLDEGGVARALVRQRREGVLDELVHVELVVGEEDVVLEMRRAGGGVMREPRQRVVDALRREGRQRPRSRGGHSRVAVDDVIVGGVEVGHVEDVAQRPVQRVLDGAFHVGVLAHGEVQRNGGVGGADADRHPVVLQEQADLVDQIALEEIRAGDGGLVEPRLGHVPERKPGIDLGVARGREAHRRVEGAVAALGHRPRHHFREVVAQEACRGVVARAQVGHRLGGVAEDAIPRLGRRDHRQLGEGVALVHRIRPAGAGRSGRSGSRRSAPCRRSSAPGSPPAPAASAACRRC